MSVSEKILEYMKSKELIYMKNEENTIFDLPYEVDDKYHIKIRIVIDEENEQIRVGFTAPLHNGSKKVKEEVLKLNPRLVKGSMGLSSTRDDHMVYNLSFRLEEDENLTEELYTTTVGFCLQLYRNLINKGILKDES